MLDTLNRAKLACKVCQEVACFGSLTAPLPDSSASREMRCNLNTVHFKLGPVVVLIKPRSEVGR